MGIFNNGASTIIINGKSHTVKGNNITVSNGKIIVDGKVVQEGLSGEVTIKFEGDLANLKSDSSVIVNGNIEGSASSGGSLKCGDIGHNAVSGGSMKCETVNGSATSGGSMNVGHR